MQYAGVGPPELVSSHVPALAVETCRRIVTNCIMMASLYNTCTAQALKWSNNAHTEHLLHGVERCHTVARPLFVTMLPFKRYFITNVFWHILYIYYYVNTLRKFCEPTLYVHNNMHVCTMTLHNLLVIGERERANPCEQLGTFFRYIYIYYVSETDRPSSHLADPTYKVRYFISDTRGPTRNHGKNTT